MTELTHEQRVARGAALLDRVNPGWWKRIDLERLSLGSCKRCVLGQLYGEYAIDAFRALGLPDNDAGDEQAEHGFTFRWDEGCRRNAELDADLAALQARWVELITDRRGDR